MHTLSIPQSVVERVIERRGREHIYDNLDPAKTALVVVDMQNAFMLPGVAHALCPMAEKIVPNINRLARAVRDTGGTVVWIKTTFTDDALRSWSTYFDMVTPQHGAKRVQALAVVCREHDVQLRQAALQFAAAHPLVVSIIPGAVSPDEVDDNIASLSAPIPSDFWSELKRRGLLHPDAPVPSG
jgi:hypothetical protein